MSLFERMERGLERTVNGVFARAFRSEVQPLELASAVRRAMDDRATMLGRGRTIVPNVFAIELSETDYERLTEYDAELEEELVAAAEEHAESQRYRPGGPLQVSFVEDTELETGVFRIRPATSREPDESTVRRRGASRSPQAAGHDAGRREDSHPQASYPEADEYTSGSWELSDAAVASRPPAAPPAAPAPAPREARPTPPAAASAAAPAATPPSPPSRMSVDERPWLEIDGERYPLLGAMTVLGRDESADVVLDDPGISRRHCEVRVTVDGPRLVSHLRDLGSTNGTLVGGVETDAQRLQDGDEITVGRTVVTFRAGRR